jgi:hypothetical protein
MYPRSKKSPVKSSLDDENDALDEKEGEDEILGGDAFAFGNSGGESEERDDVAAIFDKGGEFPVDW